MATRVLLPHLVTQNSARPLRRRRAAASVRLTLISILRLTAGAPARRSRSLRPADARNGACRCSSPDWQRLNLAFPCPTRETTDARSTPQQHLDLQPARRLRPGNQGRLWNSAACSNYAPDQLQRSLPRWGKNDVLLGTGAARELLDLPYAGPVPGGSVNGLPVETDQRRNRIDDHRQWADRASGGLRIGPA